MKKFTLFLVAMTMSLFSFAAQPKRIYAYDLSSALVDKVYTFSFTANETPTSGKIIFYDATSGELVGEIALTTPVLGKNDVEIAEYSLPGADGQQLNWAVELSAAAVTAIDALNDPSLSQFKFYLPQDVAVDNSPESDFFGHVYVANPGTGSGYVAAGISVYDQELNKLGDGYKATGHTISGRTDIHRLAVQPQTGKIYYAKTGSSTAIYELIPNKNGALSDGGASVNVISGVSEIKNANSLCFDENGLLWILNYANYVDNKTTGVIYSVDNKVATLFTKNDPNIYQWVSYDNAIAPDGLGGFWVAQYRSNFDGFYVLSHVNKEGVLDFYINNKTNNTLIPTSGSSGSINASYRGHLAYYSKEKMLAFGGADRVSLFTVNYDAGGKPTLTKIGETPSIRHTDSNKNIDGIAFDYAGNLYMASATREKLFIYTLPTANNTCEVPAKKADVVTKVEPTVALYTITTNVNDPIMGSVSGNLGTYEDGAFAELTAVANDHYEFTGWTGDVNSTENPLTINVDGNKNITANFAKKQYTLTVQANDPTKGSVALDPAGGIYEYETEVTLTATANDGYEFVNWSNGSTDNPLTMTVTGEETITAHFRAILASSITLNAHPIKDYSASIAGTMKRAIQNGENTIVLTHEANGTAHIYNIAHATKTVTEISQEGVVAVDPDNAGDFLAISDIALTADGKLVACNYMLCQNTASYVDAGYKRGTTRFYIWDEIDGDPTLWFTSQQSVNYYRARVGYTMALKGTSDDAWVLVAGFNNNATGPARFDHYHIVNGSKSTTSPSKAANMSYSAIGSTYEISASPLADGNWVLDGELAVPTEFVESKDNQEMTIFTPIAESVLGKKYNGATYLANYNDHHLMIAPYAGADGKLAGVKVLGISDGFDAATLVTTATDLTTPIDATSAAATAYVDGDGDLTIYLIADGKVYPFSEKAYTAQTFTITAIAGEGGTVEGSGPYEENTTATLTATPAEHYDFLNWTYGSETSTDNPLTITVNSDMTITANFQEHDKYTITAVANDENMGTVTGGDTYYAGESATLKATAKSGYVFAGWADGEKNATRTVTVSGDATYTANFQAIAPRAWAYDLKVEDDGDNYKFTFNATAAGSATVLFADIDGNSVAPTSYDAGPVVAGANTVSVAKTAFTENKDVYWSVKIDGEAIPAISEVTDQSRGIYDFYNMMGVVVDNDPNSNDFGKIYIQQSYEYPGTGNTVERNKTQKAGIFIYDQKLDELNDPENTGIQPQLPYTLGGDRQNFKRITINPANGNIAFCNNKTENGGAYSVSRADLTSEAVNLTKDIADIKNVNALCFDKDGNLYVVANVVTNYTNGDIYKIAADGTYAKLTPLRPDGKKIWVNEEIAIVSDGRGGIWVAQMRDNIDQYSALFHVNFEKSQVDFVLEKDQDYSDWFEGTNRRGAIAYDTQRNVLAVHGSKVASLFSVEYDAEGVPTIAKLLQTPTIGSMNIDGLAFDYAGDLYLVSSGTEKFYKYTLPTEDNICTVPAPASQKLVLGTQCEVTVTVNDPAMGSVEGAGQYEKGATVELEATANEHYQFVNWTKGAEVLSTENPYSFTVQEDVTIIANFAELPTYTITVQANNNAMGSVEGGGTVYVGESVEIKAIPNSGHAFVKWDDGNTEATRTVEVVGDKTYTAIFQAMNPRAWAYDLRMVEDGDNYKFTFKATSAGDATLLFTNKAGTPVAPTSYAVGSVEAGEKSVTIAQSEFGGTEDIYWSVQMDGAAIENMIEITDASGNYDFFMPQDVKVDNSPNSMYFGQVYVAAAVEGAARGGTQKRGIFVYDQKLAELNTPNVGYLPANVTLTDATRHAIHRLAVNPINGYVAFAYNVSGSSAVWSLNPADMSGNAVNLIDNSITAANSICFDEEGALYVMDNANAGSIGGQIYKEDENGKLNLFAAHNKDFQWANADNALAPDGRGGLWIVQNRWQVDGYPVLSHVDKDGLVDFAVTSSSSEALKALFPYDDNNASYRGQCAYYAAEDILAFGGNKEAVLFKVTYDINNVPTNLEKLMSTGKLGTNIDGLAFDYAGDLYVASETTHRMYKFVIPTADNTCTVPAPESQAIKLETRYTVTVVANDDAMGTASDGGEYTAGETITLTATAKDGYRFINWTKGAEVLSTETSFTYTVPAENVTIVANFELITYTLITSTNDENKGTVSVDGVCTHGSTVTLTATAKPGYKLLYWSDRSTDNPRSITMTKNEAISAYFVKEYAEEPTFTITKMWENTNVPASTNNGYQAVGWDGKIYMKDRLGAAINVYTETGSELYVESDALTAETDFRGDQAIAIDGVGNIIIRSGSGEFFNNPTQVTIYKNGEKTGRVIDFTLPATGRCDFISASGDIYSAEGGYVYFYCQNQTTVSRLYIKNGGASAADISVDKLDNATLTAGSTQSHVFTNIFGDLMTHTRDNNYKVLQEVNVLTGAVSIMNLPNFKKSTLGGCSFELGGKELIAYNIKGTDYNSEWNLYNMTDKQFLSAETLYAKDKVSKNSAANWLNVQVVDENTAYIYQFCPTVAVAVWKVTCNTDITVTIGENADNTTALTPYKGKEVIANVTRNFGANKILTLTLPFDLDAVQISQYFGNATVYEFYSVVDAGEELHLQFSRTTSLEAGKPYLIQTTSGYDAEDGFTIENVVISTELNPVKLSGITMVPVLDAGGTLDQPTQYYLSNNALYCAKEYNQPLLGLRAFFTSDSPTPIRARVTFNNNEETSIPVVTAPENNTQKVIKDGRLIIIRGEQQYNAQGQIIE